MDSKELQDHLDATISPERRRRIAAMKERRRIARLEQRLHPAELDADDPSEDEDHR